MKINYFYPSVVAILFCVIHGVYGSSKTYAGREKWMKEQRRALLRKSQNPLEPEARKRILEIRNRQDPALIDEVKKLMKSFFDWVAAHRPDYGKKEPECFWVIEGVLEDLKKYPKLYFSKLEYNLQFPSQISIVFQDMPKQKGVQNPRGQSLPEPLPEPVGKVKVDCPTYLDDKSFKKLTKVIFKLELAQEAFGDIMEKNTLLYDPIRFGKFFLVPAPAEDPTLLTQEYPIFSPQDALSALILTSGRTEKQELWTVLTYDPVTSSAETVSEISFFDTNGETTSLQCNDCDQTRNLNSAASQLAKYVKILGPCRLPNRPEPIKTAPTSAAANSPPKKIKPSLNHRKVTELKTLLNKEKGVVVEFMKTTILTDGDTKLKNVKLRGATFTGGPDDYRLILSADNGFATAPLSLMKGVKVPDVFKTSPFYNEGEGKCEPASGAYRCWIEDVKVLVLVGA